MFTSMQVRHLILENWLMNLDSHKQNVYIAEYSNFC